MNSVSLILLIFIVGGLRNFYDNIVDEIKLHESFEQSMKKLQRLCLTTFDSKGKNLSSDDSKLPGS